MGTESILNGKKKAQSYLRGNNLKKARAEYTRLTTKFPHDPESWFMLGLINRQQGLSSDAIPCFETVLQLTAGQHAESHYHLGCLSNDLEDIERAFMHFNEALRINPNFANAYNDLGIAHLNSGNHDKAIACYKEALRINPSSKEAHFNLGKVLEDQNRLPESLTCYLETLRMNAGFKPAESGVLRLLEKSNDLDAVKFILETEKDKHPDKAYCYIYLGNLYWRQGLFHEAESVYRKALELDAADVNTWIGLGNTLQDSGKYDESSQCYLQALALAPENASAHYNKGALHLRQMKYTDALAEFDIAIQQQPHFVEAHWHKAFVCLLTGDYDQGWRQYEWRHQRKDNKNTRAYLQPVWDGSGLSGKTILVHDEQGCGDTFQFIRYLPLVKAEGGRVVFECRHGLGPVLKGCSGCDQLLERVSYAQIPKTEFDVHIHLMSLPGIYETRLDSIPNKLPYLRPDPLLVEKWRDYFAEDHNFKVGIVWAGSPGHTNEANRSCRLEEFLPLSQIPGVSLYSLQKGEGAKQADTLPAGMTLSRLDKIIDLETPFTDTAAVMENLDLIITIDTSIAHLAGALGRPVWTLICATPDWRWLLERTDSPWYPRMRLFRQVIPNHWRPVIDEVTESLKSLVFNA